jgi:hypothetical protein
MKKAQKRCTSFLGVHLSPELMEVIDAEVRRQQAQRPGECVSRAGIVRTLICRHLQESAVPA